MTSKFLEDYRLAEPTIRRLYDSGLRVGIVDALKDGPLRLADLRRVVDSNAPNTSSKAKELEEMGVLERTPSGDYALTPYGQAIRVRAQDSFEFYATYEKFKEFWQTHYTDGIPPELWLRLGELNNSILITTKEKGNMNAVNEIFLELLGSIKHKFYGVSPIYHSEWFAMAIELVKRGVDTEIIITENVVDLIRKDASKEDLKIISGAKNIHWPIIKGDVKVAFTVSEGFLSLALKTIDTGFVLDMDLDSTDPRAVKWGFDLYDFYRKQTSGEELKDYL